MVGEYRLVDFLGAGGMGEVYRAMHAKIGRIAAIKVLTVAARNDPGFNQRFSNEARIQASLQHPNIATLYDYTQVQGQPCIIMEYVDGQTLCDRVRPYGPLHHTEALQIFAAVCDAIAYIHSHGIIHRDIKSNNIKIGSSGQVKLLDFGIAKLMGNMNPGLTETGSVVGTLEYISPEQLATGVADPRSDIWALGVLLYEMTTGRVPFEAQTLPGIIDKIGRVDYLPPKQLNPAIPADVVTIITRCLKKNPGERYQTATALLQDVRRVQAGLAAGPPPPKPPKPPKPGTGPLRAATMPLPTTTAPENIAPEPSWLSRNWFKLTGVSAVLAMFLLFGGYGLYYACCSDPSSETVGGSGLTNNRSGKDMKTVMVEMNGTPDAEIWVGDKKLGVGKAEIPVPVGGLVEVRLKLHGKEETQKFPIAPNKRTYTLTFGQSK